MTEKTIETYEEALNYIIDGLDNKLYFNLMNKEIYCDMNNEPISKKVSLIKFDKETMLEVNKIATDKIKFINKDNELSIDTSMNFYKDCDNLQLEIIDKRIKLSDNAKILFSKAKAMVNLVDEIYNSLNKEQDFVNAYYKFYNEDEKKAASSIISVIKVFQSLQQLILDLINDYKENCRVMNDKKINSILNSIIGE